MTTKSRMSTEDKLNKIAKQLFGKTYAELTKNGRDVAFKIYLKENATEIK